MARRTPKWTLVILSLLVLLPSSIVEESEIYGDSLILDQVQALVPVSLELVDNTIDILEDGWDDMSSEEQALFGQLFDPGETGEINNEFVEDSLNNYRRIRDRLSESLNFALSFDSDRCEAKRLYYTDLVKIYVCPYFSIEASEARKARVLIHEVAHMALLVVDRPYFHKNTYSTRYRALTPRGSWTAEIPLFGPIFREIAHSDTLYHPDAYAWFSVELRSS